MYAMYKSYKTSDCFLGIIELTLSYGNNYGNLKLQLKSNFFYISRYLEFYSKTSSTANVLTAKYAECALVCLKATHIFSSF